MSNATAVSDASDKLRWMIKKEARGPGDAGAALCRIIKRHRLRASAVRQILYYKPADIYLSVYLSIQSAFEAEVARWERNFEHERAIARARTGVGAALLRLADQLDRVADQVRGPQDGGLSDDDEAPR